MTPSDIERIVVHCSATSADMDIGLKEIDRWHRQRGFWKVGYHSIIRRDGQVETGRDLTQVGAHAQGFNMGSWGVCMVGGLDAKGKPEDNYTAAQYEALKAVIAILKAKASQAKVLGHRDLSPDKNGDGVITPDEYMKECPCFDVQDWYGANFQPAS